MVLIVDAFNATDDVAEATFSMMVIHACSRHQRTRGAPKIVYDPIRSAVSRVEFLFGPRKVLEWLLAIIGEYIPAIIAALRFQHSKRCI